VRAGLEAQQYLLVGTALAVGMLTLYSMIKIWNEAFWKPQPEEDRPAMPQPLDWRLVTPVVVCAVGVSLMGIFAEPVLGYALRAAEQLLDPTVYIAAVQRTGL
jgi:multicomponent Na+:H+ antiporter subunit D